ncbi:hypothetical protein ACIBVL_15740 [Streptomyces sp. NPDC049687]|uniref:hypothetical protein n=1 Tax=Streptomyces sp. NPDC049687 TaxID=3365596 RepID=UPI0037BB9791
MVQLERGPRGADRTQLECQSIGDALLVHPEGRINPQVRAFAGGLAQDPEHTLVVVDLPEDPPAEDWESVARLLKRRGRSFRVITGRPSRETAMTVGQLLADRLERTVLTPDGWVLPAAGGMLFVPEAAGSGWLGFQPRRSAAWTRLGSHKRAPRVSRRFPVPYWDDAVPENSFATSAEGTAEPLPGGVWIRRKDQPAGDQDVHRRRLIASLLPQSARLTVVLGCPGDPHLRVGDIERFWERVTPYVRSRVRFALYGPVGVPEGNALGQILADRLGHEIIVYGGLPTVGEPGADGALIRVLGEDGTLGPAAFARELVYRPTRAGSVAPTPLLLDCRAPVEGLPEISTGVYWYAPDAVLEVTQSGLWLRPPEASADAPAVHSVPAHLGRMVIHVDEGTPESAQRMRSLAEEVRQKLDPVLAEGCLVLPAPKHEAEGNSGAASAAAGVAHSGSVPAAGEIGPAGGVTGEPGSETGATGPAGVVRESAPRPAVRENGPVGSVPEGPAEGRPRAAPEASQPVPVVGVTEPGTAPAVPVAGVTEPEPAPAAPAAPVTPESRPSTPAPVRPRSLRLESAPPPGAAPAASAEGTASGAGIAEPYGVPEPVADPAPQAPPRPTPPPVSHSPAHPPAVSPASPRPPAADPSEPPTPAPARTPEARPKAQPPAVRVQPVPEPEACAVPPERGIEQERAWLRRTLKGQYDSAANHVARVLSESPGLRGASRQSADEVVTDLVAVRLYLSGGTDGIDSAVRGATVGPHVPLARCVASGLRRLPSYRGATLLRTTLSEAEWQWYGKRRLVTEWAFCSALTTAHPEMAGDVDVLIWSMTARRTALLDAAVPDRVLYLPGTSFKVLGVRDEERRVLLLRELTGPEIGADGSVDLRRLPLDDIAMTGLEQAATEWHEAKPAAVRLPATAATALRNPPGLIVTGRNAAPRRADTAPPRKGTTP